MGLKDYGLLLILFQAGTDCQKSQIRRGSKFSRCIVQFQLSVSKKDFFVTYLWSSISTSREGF